MNRLQQYVASRHSSYTTQFQPPLRNKVFLNRAAMRHAVSKKSLERRLILPLDSKNWARALEVLSAGYAKLSRKPEHYQQVVRLMVSTASSPRTSEDVVQAMNRVRDAALAGEIPSNGSLYVTLVWAYVELVRPEEAAECLLQGERQNVFSPPSRRHAVELVVPLLCRSGLREVAMEMIRLTGDCKERFSKDLAEASALQGDWKAFRTPAQCSSHPDSGVLPCATLTHISAKGLRAMLLRALEEKDTGAAAVLWNEAFQTRQLTVHEEELLALLNCFGVQDDFVEVVRWFSHVFLSGCATKYLPAEATLTPVSSQEMKYENSFYMPPREQFCNISLSPVALNLVFASYPLRHSCNTVSPPTLPSMPCHPKEVCALLDDILIERDDAQVTNYMLARVTPALLHLGCQHRALRLISQASLLSSPLKRPPREEEQRLQEDLLRVTYALYRHFSSETSQENNPVPLALPHLFPSSTAGRKGSRYSADAERLAEREQAPPSSVRPSLQQYFALRSTASLTERMESVRKGQLTQQAAPAFTGDPERDPRPPPLGLHDTANGWSFFGRGGEMVFFNSRRTPHLLSSHPKVMRSRANPFRGWRLKENSSLGHRENVMKWNGMSSE